MKNDTFINLQLDDLDFDFNLEPDKDSNKFIKLENHNVKNKDVFYENAQKLVHDINIQRGECVYVNLAGNFIFGDFIGAFITCNSLDVAELTVISLSGAIDNFEMLDELMNNGYVEKINLVLSKYYLRTEQKKHSKTIQFLSDLIDKHKGLFNVYYADNHSKSVLIRTKKGGYVSMHGSANLRSSTNIEQMIIQENKELYDFNYSFFKNLI